MTQTLTVQLPSELYGRIKKRADEACRTVENEAVKLLAATVSGAEQSDLASTWTALEMLDDAGLEQAARSRLAVELALELESLHLKQQREGLTVADSARCAELVRAYERSMLMRAYAAALLKQRGLDVSPLVAPP